MVSSARSRRSTAWTGTRSKAGFAFFRAIHRNRSREFPFLYRRQRIAGTVKISRPAIRLFRWKLRAKTGSGRLLRGGRRQIHQEETDDAVFVVAFIVVLHSRVISVLQHDELVWRRRIAEKLRSESGKRRLLRRIEIELSDARKVCDSRGQGRHRPVLGVEPAKIACDNRVTSGIDPRPDRVTCTATMSFGFA